MPTAMAPTSAKLPCRRQKQNAAAASFVLVLMTLGMNGLAIWLRYRLRKNLKW